MMRDGVRVAGGCCGTTPEYIEKTVKSTKDLPFVPNEKKDYTLVSSYTHAVKIGKYPIIIGERINPTGKPRLKKALLDGDNSYILSEAIKQDEYPICAIDVNCGLPGVDEKAKIKELGIDKTIKGHTPEMRLQSYFIGRVEKIVEKYGRKIIGWDEILQGGISKSATVMSWRGSKGGIAAAKLAN